MGFVPLLDLKKILFSLTRPTDLQFTFHEDIFIAFTFPAWRPGAFCFGTQYLWRPSGTTTSYKLHLGVRSHFLIRGGVWEDLECSIARGGEICIFCFSRCLLSFGVSMYVDAAVTLFRTLFIFF